MPPGSPQGGPNELGAAEPSRMSYSSHPASLPRPSASTPIPFASPGHNPNQNYAHYPSHATPAFRGGGVSFGEGVTSDPWARNQPATSLNYPPPLGTAPLPRTQRQSRPSNPNHLPGTQRQPLPSLTPPYPGTQGQPLPSFSDFLRGLPAQSLSSFAPPYPVTQRQPLPSIPDLLPGLLRQPIPSGTTPLPATQSKYGAHGMVRGPDVRNQYGPHEQHGQHSQPGSGQDISPTAVKRKADGSNDTSGSSLKRTR
ncbi:hypothetical protein F4778DRAFT_730431 [Xylariomycetidae sp. FL2044]|nr:hypothetical protein F4778DRAFT_730431 [Xylariomycetidae sp. FL2044]